ncbi:MAG: hypothetical protein ACRER2_19685 [Methylococcales bacterium]
MNVQSTCLHALLGYLTALLSCLLLLNAPAAFPNSLTAGPVVGSTDFGMFGISGLRGTGTGTITVSGITGTVTQAILVWHGLAGVSTTLQQSATVSGTPFAGTNIGLSSDNCWGQSSSQAFQADVTSVVTGNGLYPLVAC